MSVNKIDHIGIAVPNIEEALVYYRDTLGLEFHGTEVVAEQKVKVAFLGIGESKIELLEPTSDDSPVAKFIEKRGSGIHHIAINVDDIEKSLKAHAEAGYRLIDQTPRKGAHEMLIAFIHPKSTSGVLLELCQPSH